MNIQIRVEVPADKSKSYSMDNLVQLITDTKTVNAILATILAFEEDTVEINKIGVPEPVAVVNVNDLS